MLEMIPVKSEEQISEIKELFREYSTSLGFDLSFQNFQQELGDLPGEYSPPEGRLILAVYNGQTAGCAALRKSADGISEMKRLYVRPEFRGLGIGRALAEVIIEEARIIGYSSMRLDTVSSMEDASRLYRSLGFRETGPYRYNPLENAVFMEKKLSVPLPDSGGKCKLNN